MARSKNSPTDGTKTQPHSELPLTVVVPIKPIAASRPRIPRYGKPYFAKTYANWRKEADESTTGPADGWVPIAYPVRATVLFAIPRAKSSKLLVPAGDGDNYEKSIYDFLQRAGWMDDDKWITTGIWRKRFLPHGETGYTEVILEEEDEQLDIE